MKRCWICRRTEEELLPEFEDIEGEEWIESGRWTDVHLCPVCVHEILVIVGSAYDLDIPETKKHADEKKSEKVFDTRDFVVPPSEGKEYFVPQYRKCPKCGGILEGPTISDKLENDGLYWCKLCAENYRPSFNFTGFVTVKKKVD